MIFFENRCPIFWVKRYLSIRRVHGPHLRPPSFFLVFLFFLLSSTSFGMQVTLSLKSVSLETAFAEIKKQSGYGFWYEKKDLEGLQKVTLELKNAALVTALEACLKDQPLTYQVFDKTVVVKRKAVSTPLVLPNKKSFQDKVRGKVVDAQTNEPLAGVLVKVKLPAISVVTDDKGIFELTLANGKYDLVVQYLGYGIREMNVSVPLNDELNIALVVGEETLNAVQIISNGYENLSKERATGSFVQIDNDLLNRNGVSTNLLSRLDGIVSGTLFNNVGFEGNGSKQARQSSIEVRGRSTLFSEAEPLIVLDNFPYDGDLNNINPNDIESITILRDAAAASAWGARSGNGVIVVTTKKGKLNSPATLNFTSSLNIGDRPDLFYMPQLNSAQYIEVQRLLFDRGVYNNAINTGYTALAPAVEVMLGRRNGSITAIQEDEQLDVLRGYDARLQLQDYNYRNALQQQYQANVSGGSTIQKYFLSVGFNNNTNGTVNSDFNRVTLNASNTYLLLDSRLELFSNIVYTTTRNRSGATLSAAYPYTQFADEKGNPLVVERDLRLVYAAGAGNGRLLDWLFRPLDEVRNNYGRNTNDQISYRINSSLNYKFFEGFKASLMYSFERGIADGKTLYEQQSYYSRHLINRFSQLNTNTGAVTYPVPLGGVMNNNMGDTRSHSGRLQLDYVKKWAAHGLNVLAGAEIKDQSSTRNTVTWFGYDPETELSQNGAINYLTEYPMFYNSAITSRIGSNMSRNGSFNRFLSQYFIASYDYDRRFILSLSARKDESNLFGVATNQKGVPLWSAGIAWNVDKESFMRLDWLSLLKLRATYGLTGNVNNSISAYLTATNTVQNDYNSNYATIVNPPNPDLRWEKIENVNLGLDFGIWKGRLSGNVDIWQKKGFDLIGNSPVAAQTGIVLYTGNSANTLTQGLDIQLNSLNLDGVIKWQTHLLYNLSRSKVTKYKVSNGTNLNVVSANSNNPLEGYPYYSVFSFAYAGLNGLGAPQGYLNGQVTTDYAAIRNSINRDELVFHGSAVPVSFGSLRNTFNYKGIDLSFNIAYKFDYYFRRRSLDNSALYSTGVNYQMADYDKRWQNSGDELLTDVPALIYPANVNRTNLYTYSNALIEKGDHIRLQDLRLGYTLLPKRRAHFKSINIFSYVSNLGLLWRANKFGIDPDSPNGIPNVRTIALGMSIGI